MVTKTARLKFISRAVFSFNSQTYPEKELIILHDSGDEFHETLIEQFGSDTVKIVQSEKSYLGTLRNKSVEVCSGDVICQWDDDDYSHPDRLQIQYDRLIESNMPVCFLSSHAYTVNDEFYILDKSLGKPFISSWRVAQNSLMAHKDRLPKYPDSMIGEDTPITEYYTPTQSVTSVVDKPYLFCTTYHSGNSWDIGHHMKIINRYRTNKYGDEFKREFKYLLKCNDVI